MKPIATLLLATFLTFLPGEKSHAQGEMEPWVQDLLLDNGHVFLGLMDWELVPDEDNPATNHYILNQSSPSEVRLTVDSSPLSGPSAVLRIDATAEIDAAGGIFFWNVKFTENLTPLPIDTPGNLTGSAEQGEGIFSGLYRRCVIAPVDPTIEVVPFL